VIGDKKRTQQIIEALIDNAVKFTNPGGVIKVAVHGGPDAYGKVAFLLTVTDTGIGISETDQDRIFERFTQVDGSIKRAYGGTGLGLTVAQDLAELMGGALHVKSELGMGSTFTVRLAFQASMETAKPLLAAAQTFLAAAE